MRFTIEQVRFDQAYAWGKRFEVYLCGDRRQQSGGIYYGTLEYDSNLKSWYLSIDVSVYEPYPNVNNRRYSITRYYSNLSEATEGITKKMIGSMLFF